MRRNAGTVYINGQDKRHCTCFLDYHSSVDEIESKLFPTVTL